MPLPTDDFHHGRPILSIDLDAVAANWRTMRTLAPGAEVGGVLKANGYGLGAPEILTTLAAEGCRSFFTATVDEALALRTLAPGARLYVMGGLPRGAEADLAAVDIVPVLDDPTELERWREEAVRQGRRLPAAIQLDTGMCRLGFDPPHVPEIDLTGLEPVLVMSHMATADEPDHPQNERQRLTFDELRARLPAMPASLAASSGILLGEAYHYDLVRPGLALYGCQPVPSRPIPLAPVVTLTAPVLQVHKVERAGAVGYGALHPVLPGMLIATLPLGYADGYLRAAGGRTTVRMAGREVDVVGRVSMDLITIDVTALGADAVRPGMAVEVIGGAGGVERVAEAAGTIPYEILVRLGSRLERRYVGGSA